MSYLKDQFLLGFNGGFKLFISPFAGFVRAFREIWKTRVTSAS